MSDPSNCIQLHLPQPPLSPIAIRYRKNPEGLWTNDRET
jgi:hypothetical protein